MTRSKFIALLLLLPFLSCGQRKAKPAAVALTKEASYLLRYMSQDSDRKAISMLNESIGIDKDYYWTYYYKRMYYMELQDYKGAIEAGNNCIRLSPHSVEDYISNGATYEIMNDTASARVTFQKALSICNSLLDTMSANTNRYFMTGMNKGTCLIMLGDSLKGNTFFKTLYEVRTKNALQDSINREGLTATLMNKNRQQIIDQWKKEAKESENILNRHRNQEMVTEPINK